jgi:hypothetical protein
MWVRQSAERFGVWDLYPAMAQHAAMICPRGNGLDTHRAWETLYMGRLPILQHSALDPLWEDLPALLLNNWTMLMDSEQLVVDAVRESTRRGGSFNAHKLFFPWWACRIGIAAGREAEFCTGKEGLVAVLNDEGRAWARGPGREALNELAKGE